MKPADCASPIQLPSRVPPIDARTRGGKIALIWRSNDPEGSCWRGTAAALSYLAFAPLSDQGPPGGQRRLKSARSAAAAAGCRRKARRRRTTASRSVYSSRMDSRVTNAFHREATSDCFVKASVKAGGGSVGRSVPRLLKVAINAFASKEPSNSNIEEDGHVVKV